jgi:hypothetical protein
MTARNSILLIVKQQPGMEYNSLLNKIAGNYGSIESARAALSRSIRYLTALGLVVRRENKLFATGKGAAQLHSEMQNKLLWRLNDLMGRKDASTRFGNAVELLQTLIERSKQDKDLLIAAKGSVDFYISDLASLEKEVEKRVHSMQYLHKIFEQQIDSLKELDFPDFRKMAWSKESKKRIQKIVEKLRAKVFTAECLNEGFRQKAAEHFSVKGRQNDLFFEAKQLPKFLNFVENNSASERNVVNLFIGGIKIKIDFPYIFVTAPFKQLNQLLAENEHNHRKPTLSKPL